MHPTLSSRKGFFFGPEWGSAAMNFVTGLVCKECGKSYSADKQFVCTECFGPLEAAYDYKAIKSAVPRESLQQRPRNLWRYKELLPVVGEPATGFQSGFTPLVRATRLA